jgi:predicted nucleic acid-binding protein
MRRVFADTFYFIALLSPNDQAHRMAVEFSNGYDGRMVTTDWIITEMADGMAAPASRQKFISFLDMLRADPDVFIAPLDKDLQEEDLEIYRNRLDKSWSLTDCISFVVMRREGVIEALTGDHHFEQAGFVALLK